MRKVYKMVGNSVQFRCSFKPTVKGCCVIVLGMADTQYQRMWIREKVWTAFEFIYKKSFYHLKQWLRLGAPLASGKSVPNTASQSHIQDTVSVE